MTDPLCAVFQDLSPNQARQVWYIVARHVEDEEIYVAEMVEKGAPGHAEAQDNLKELQALTRSLSAAYWKGA